MIDRLSNPAREADLNICIDEAIEDKRLDISVSPHLRENRINPLL